jgi:NADPH:quinone reductase-like Zn-dependent oxidoreductase
MRIYQIPKPEGIDSLVLREAPTPKLGRGQVLVKMRAASLNYRDLMVLTGRYARGAPLPDLVPLSDGAGEVADIGPEVTRVKPGDRVAGIFMQSWIGGDIEPDHAASSLGGAIHGVLAEYVLFDQQGLVHLPSHLSFEEGATLPCAGVTAWNALYAGRPLIAGQSVLVLGTGGVSIFALQFARAAGAQVIATSSSNDKLARATQLGATATVNYRDHPEWQKEVLALTDGRGVDHVIEVGGAGTLARSIEAARLGGQIHQIGVLTGGGGQIDPSVSMRKGLILRGIYVGSRQMFDAMNRAIAGNSLRPVIDRVFAFAQAADAYRHMQSQAHLGKIVIRIE